MKISSTQTLYLHTLLACILAVGTFKSSGLTELRNARSPLAVVQAVRGNPKCLWLLVPALLAVAVAQFMSPYGPAGKAVTLVAGLMAASFWVAAVACLKITEFIGANRKLLEGSDSTPPITPEQASANAVMAKRMTKKLTKTKTKIPNEMVQALKDVESKAATAGNGSNGSGGVAVSSSSSSSSSAAPAPFTVTAITDGATVSEMSATPLTITAVKHTAFKLDVRSCAAETLADLDENALVTLVPDSTDTTQPPVPVPAAFLNNELSIHFCLPDFDVTGDNVQVVVKHPCPGASDPATFTFALSVPDPATPSVYTAEFCRATWWYEEQGAFKEAYDAALSRTTTATKAREFGKLSALYDADAVCVDPLARCLVSSLPLTEQVSLSARAAAIGQVHEYALQDAAKPIFTLTNEHDYAPQLWLLSAASALLAVMVLLKYLFSTFVGRSKFAPTVARSSTGHYIKM